MFTYQTDSPRISAIMNVTHYKFYFIIILLSRAAIFGEINSLYAYCIGMLNLIITYHLCMKNRGQCMSNNYDCNILSAYQIQCDRFMQYS